MGAEAFNTKQEQQIMSLIISSGQARSNAQEALMEAKKGNFDLAKEKMKCADQSILDAHKVQTSLLSMEAKGELVQMNILMVHAQDHLMTGMLAIDMIKELIEIYESKEEK
ncbi:PTS lactose/cellobiose transporter subunit IIA [Vallitalea pronyensis]|uniref:PTS lactose/cellobiose transporter subunit IIA n=1 Tax=Vallitalea pronyensis TaxID=1348613 RepID=A0A8J8MIV8_9FIRM|nr:PTS lactose/cellobiose transporter subunit IIA [Vallitalea pronyensis]QUI22098.1 PTS lactose/cellobiose transporter subunit IIA [Vallitalea pronyensis]